MIINIDLGEGGWISIYKKNVRINSTPVVPMILARIVVQFAKKSVTPFFILLEVFVLYE